MNLDSAPRVKMLNKIRLDKFDLSETKYHITETLQKLAKKQPAKELYNFFLFMEDSLKE